MAERGGDRERRRRGHLSITHPHNCPISNPQSPISLRTASRTTEQPFQRIWVEQVETPRILRELGASLYHGLAFVAPLRAPCPTVVTVHDLSFMTRPGTHKLFNRLYLTLFTRWSCRRAARVIAVSQWTKRDVASLLGIDPERVDVIPHGVHPRFRRLPEDDVAAFKRAHAIPDRCVFFLGSLEPRKNLATLIDAFAALRTQDSGLGTHLIVGGAPGWKYEPIFERVEALGIQERVRFEGQIAHDDLPFWYNACAAFAYPSLYEGFGMPVLEAMACGAPVVTSDAASLPEVVGEAGLMVAPADAGGLAQALGRVLSDDALRADLSRRSVERAAAFTWRRTAELTMETYRRAVLL